MNEIKIHPGIAAVLAFVFSGLGQLYNGELVKGFVMMSVAVAALLVFLSGSVLLYFSLLNREIFNGQGTVGSALLCAGIFFIGYIGIYSIVDAYEVAKKKCG